MFGLNDTSSQSVNSSDGQSSGAASPLAQPNPFADTASSDPAPLPEAVSGSLPPAAPSPDIIQSPALSAAPKSDDLLDLKEQALTSLQPLVSHLDQTPEEKFKTTMMLIQATDNPALVKDAYEAANQITDEKARAQALLDVVNEINYFTQHNGETEGVTA